MIDVRHKKCAFKDCKTSPRFNLPEFENALYCTQHSTERYG